MSGLSGMQISLINLGKLYTTGYGGLVKSKVNATSKEVLAKDFKLARLFLERALKADGQLTQEALNSIGRLDLLEKTKETQSKTCSIL